MTYALAWKSKNEVFLAADSALTTSAPTKPYSDKSSFGQKHIRDDLKNVEEKSTKLFLKNKIGITFAGRYELAIRVTKSFYEKIEEGFNYKKALKNAIFLNSPFPEGANLQLTVAYYDGKPHLLSYNSLEGSKITTDKKIVHMGSIPEPLKRLNEEWMLHMIPQAVNDPKQLLVSQLAFLQSSNIFNSLLDMGIGGAFSGLYIDQRGGSWQPDTIFIDDDKYVSTCFRHDCFIINSPIIGQSRCFLTYLPPKLIGELREQVSKAMQKGEKLKHSGEFEYAVISGKKGRPLVLIEMNRQNKHKLIWIEPDLDPSGKNLGMTISKFPELREIFRKHKDQALMFYFPFEKPIIKQIPDDRKFTRIIKNN